MSTSRCSGSARRAEDAGRRKRPGRDDASCRPGLGRQHEGCCWQHRATAFPQLSLPLGVETDRVAAGGTNAERERLPPVLEARVLGADRKSAVLDLAHPGCLQQLREVSLAGTRELRLILDLGVELARRTPEEAEWPPAPGVVPHARGHDAVGTSHARHLAESRDGVRHEVHDELCQGGVERLISERQLLRGSASHAHPGMALSGCRHEGF